MLFSKYGLGANMVAPNNTIVGQRPNENQDAFQIKASWFSGDTHICIINA
jgi:hypothetical protein